MLLLAKWHRGYLNQFKATQFDTANSLEGLILCDGLQILAIQFLGGFLQRTYTQIEHILLFEIIFFEEFVSSLSFGIFIGQHFQLQVDFGVTEGKIRNSEINSNNYLQLYLSIYTIHTCQLYMIVSFKTISLLLLALAFAFVQAQDTPHAPTPAAAPQPTPPHEPQPVSSQPPATQSHPNTTTTHTPTNTEHTQNIVTNDAHPATPQHQPQHHDNPSATTEQAHPTQHVEPVEHHQGEHHQPEHHQTEIHPDIPHEELEKVLQQMTDQQLKHFEDSLEGEAREYYEQLMKEEEKLEHQEEVEYEEEYKQVEGELSKTDKEYELEEEQFRKQQRKFAHQLINYNEYLFQLDEGNNQDFKVSIPNAQQIIFHGYTYENKEGTYSVTDDIQEQQPISLVIYQNNHKIVYQKTFFFKYFGSYMGNENCSYLIRFINPSLHKLIALNIGVMFENGHVVDKLTVHDVADHGRRLAVFQHEVSNKYTDMSMKSVIENENRQTLINKLDHYFTYSIVEIVMILVLCVLQVEFVKKLLSSTNIV